MKSKEQFNVIYTYSYLTFLLLLLLAVRFGHPFLKKAGFPDRENLVSDIPKEQLRGFVAGSDSVFDQAVQEERDAKRDAEDDDSLTAFYQEAEEAEEELDEEEEEERFESPQEEEQQEERNDDYYTDLRHFDQIQMDPTSVKGQCPIAEVLFKPAFAFTPVHDNDYSLEHGCVVREMMMTRLKLPAGYNEDVTISVQQKGRELHLSISEITSNFQAEIICGRKLNKEQPGLVADLCRVLQQKHRRMVGENSTKGSKYEHYVIKLPKDVEDQFRTPFDDCQRVHASCAFYHVKIPQTNTIFLYCFNLIKQVGAYGATSDVKGNIGKETVFMDNSGVGNGTANKVRNNLFAKKKKSVVSSSSQRSTSNLSKPYYDYSTVTSVLKSYETLVSDNSDDSSSLSSTESLDKTNTPFSVSSISIPAIISSSSSSASSSAAPHSIPKSLSYFTSRSSSTNYPFQRGERVSKKQPFVETVKEEDCEEGVDTTVESTKSTSVSLFSQIKTKRPTGYSRRYNDRDDDDTSFQSAVTSDKTNTNNHFWYNN